MPNRYLDMERALARKGAPAGWPAVPTAPADPLAPATDGALPQAAATSSGRLRLGRSFTSAPFYGVMFSGDAGTVTVPAEAVDRAMRLELPVPHMYLDSNGFVTVGVGHMITNAAAAAALDLRRNRDGAAATDEEKRAEWTTLARQEKNKVYTYYKQFTTLHLTDATMRGLLTADLETAIRGLRRNLPAYDSYPGKAREALIDMAFNLGVTRLMNEFPKFIAAVKAKDWATAAAESHRRGPSEARNQEIRELLESATKQ